MSHDWIVDDNPLPSLDAEDARVAAKVKANGCRFCAGRLDVATFPRKPRGSALIPIGAWLDKRRSYCCAREGCRRRATPASLVFLGRRVYVAIVVLVESLRVQQVAEPAPPEHAPPPPRTTRRWLDWFRSTLPKTDVFVAAAGRFWPPLPPAELPHALVASFDRLDRSVSECLVAALRFLSPLTTTSLPLEATIARD